MRVIDIQARPRHFIFLLKINHEPHFQIWKSSIFGDFRFVV